jgi:hypothetical protein
MFARHNFQAALPAKTKPNVVRAGKEEEEEFSFKIKDAAVRKPIPIPSHSMAMTLGFLAYSWRHHGKSHIQM